MKKIILSFIIVLCYGGLQAQYIYNNSGNAICTIHGAAFYSGGLKVAYIKNDNIYNGSGIKIGAVEDGKTLYDGSGLVICTVKGAAVYSGGKKVAYVKDNVVHDGSGIRIVSVKGVNTLQIAIYLFFIAN